HLAALIAAEEIDAVLDVGANEGQYARSLRGRGYAGRIVSFEPGAAAHAKLSAATAGDALWTAAPRMALGRSAGSAQLRAFNRSDLNSLLPAGPEAFRGFPGLVVAEAEEVSVARLVDALDTLGIDSRRTLLKIDTQGSELAVL